MRLDVRYRNNEPKKIISAKIDQSVEYTFTIEGETARLVDVRAEKDVRKGQSVLGLIELNKVHDSILELDFINRVTVWMKGRTDTEKEKEQ